MELNITAKWVLGILGTILLGAVGSGLWSYSSIQCSEDLAKY